MTKVNLPQRISVTDLPTNIGLDYLINIKDKDSLSPKSRSRASSTGRPGELAGLRSRHRGSEESSKVTRSPAESSKPSFDSTSSPKLGSRFTELLEETWPQKAENLKQKTAVEPFVHHLGVGRTKSKTATAQFADHLAAEEAKLKTDAERFIGHLVQGIDAQYDTLTKLLDETYSDWRKNFVKHDVRPEEPKQGRGREGTFSNLTNSLKSIGRRRASSTQSTQLNNPAEPGVAAAAADTAPASSAKQSSKLRTRSASVDNIRNGFSTLTKKLSVKRRKSMADTAVTSRVADGSPVPLVPPLPDRVKARKPKR
ncbi:hypothetical protein [Mycetohabitans sp. B46]|uniref:hypothetical protein n=1 Tax=Mycetohabitans sp. B46 TaxID=2772536 RepID=UPI00307ED358